MKRNGKTYFKKDVLELLLRHDNDRKTSEILVEYFTIDEYEEFRKRLTEYHILKNRLEDIIKEVEYHRKSAESHNKQMETLLQLIHQRNFIEAKEKRLDNSV